MANPAFAVPSTAFAGFATREASHGREWRESYRPTCRVSAVGDTVFADSVTWACPLVRRAKFELFAERAPAAYAHRPMSTRRVSDGAAG
jgi:hypothetical protein